MSGLLFLGNDDFNITRGTNGPILCNTLSGFSLVLFYSTQCKHCNSLIPIFKRLPGTISGCQFGMVNISIHKDLIYGDSDLISYLEFNEEKGYHIPGNKEDKSFMKFAENKGYFK